MTVNNELAKVNISKIETKKWWKVKVWDIVKVEKQEYNWWISIIWQVKSVNTEEIKIITVKPNSRSGAEITLFETRLDDDNFKLHFAYKEELEAILFKVKQEALHKVQEKKKEYEDAENKYSNTIEDVKIFNL